MVATTVAGRDVDPLRATLAGLGASFVGIGLARFAYTPLIPALIAAHWFAPSAAVYLGAANLAGYLAAHSARPVPLWCDRLGIVLRDRLGHHLQLRQI